MFGNTLTINTGTLADPVEITLKLVNEGNFQSEYRLVEEDRAHKVMIRHSTEKAKVRGRPMDRHNVTYQQDIFPTETLPEGQIFEAYTVFRVPQGVVPAAIEPLANGALHFSLANAAEIAGWES